jgi:hypothetical protein
MTASRFASSGAAQYIPRFTITGKDPSLPTELTMLTPPSSNTTTILDGQGIGLPLVPPVIKQQATAASIDWSKYIVANATPPIEAVVTTWGGADWDDWAGGAATPMLVSAILFPPHTAFRYSHSV